MPVVGPIPPVPASSAFHVHPPSSAKLEDGVIVFEPIIAIAEREIRDRSVAEEAQDLIGLARRRASRAVARGTRTAALRGPLGLPRGAAARRATECPTSPVRRRDRRLARARPPVAAPAAPLPCARPRWPSPSGRQQHVSECPRKDVGSLGKEEDGIESGPDDTSATMLPDSRGRTEERDLPRLVRADDQRVRSTRNRHGQVPHQHVIVAGRASVSPLIGDATCRPRAPRGHRLPGRRPAHPRASRCG